MLKILMILILIILVLYLFSKNKQKLSKLFRQGFEISVYWNEYKRKSENNTQQNTTNE